MLALGVGACGGSSKKSKAPPTVDPVAMALEAPGVRTVVIPQQREDLIIAVPPCGSGQVDQETTETPPGSSRIVVPKDSLAQSVAVQPCIKGKTQQTTGAGTVLISPGGAATGQSETQLQTGSAPGQNQLVIPENSDLRRIIVPPCLVIMSSSSSTSASSAGGTTSNTLALPATPGNRVVTAPPCSVMASSSSSSGG